MKPLISSLLLLVLPLPCVSQRKAKPPEVRVLEAKSRREEGKILMDGRLRATADKPIRGLVVYFDLLSPENGVVTSEKAVLDEDPVPPGEERSYHSETSENARAVRFQIRAFDKGERELRVANPGPFPIE